MKLIRDLGTRFPTVGSKNRKRFGLYECPFCLKHFETQTQDVKAGKSTKCRSCSVSIKNTTHGERSNRLYSIWVGQKQRCNNPDNKRYIDYGGRGIFFSDEIDDFDAWLKYVESLPYANKDKFSIDRIDNDKGYEIGNLRWTDGNTQSRNTRKIYKNNTSGYRGVCVGERKFTAHITLNGKVKHLGTFDSKIEAAVAYDTYIDDNNLKHTKNDVSN